MSNQARIFDRTVPKTLLGNGVRYGDPLHVPTLADVRALPNPPPDAIVVGTVAAGLTGTFVWDTTNTDPDDGAERIAVTAVGATGRYALVKAGSIAVTGNAVASVAALRALASAGLADGYPVSVKVGPDGGPINVAWSAASGAGFVDDGRTIFKPADIVSSASPGRFYLTTQSAVMPTAAAARLAVAGVHPIITTSAYATLGDQGGGTFAYDPSDTTTADNAGTVLVCGTRRYKRVYSGPVHATWFGADPSGSANCATALTAAANAARHVLLPPGTYNLPSGWSVPRSGVTIELARGALILAGDTILTNFSEVHWLGGAFGRNFNSDALSTWRPNVLWTGAINKPVMRWAFNASADGCCLDGILVDGALVSGLTAFMNGTAGFGCSGYQWGAFGGLDCVNGHNIVAACEISSFHVPYFTFRTGSLGTGTLGVGIGADANYDGGITSVTYADGGGTLSGYLKAAQLGGTVGRVSTVDFGGSNLVIEAARTSGLIGVEVYDGYACKVHDLHMELHGMFITNATNATPIVVTTLLVHGLSTGNTVKISNVLGNTAANASWVITVTSTTTFSLNASVGNGPYTSGGLVSKMDAVGIKLGSASSTPVKTLIDGNYLAGTQYPIAGYAWDKLHISNNEFEVSASGDSTHVPYAFHNVGTGPRRQDGVFGKGNTVGRGTYYGGDIDDRTGFVDTSTTNRDVNNDALADTWIEGVGTFGAISNPTITKDLTLGVDYTITSITNTTPQVVTVSSTHRLRTGDPIHIVGSTVANGDWAITYLEKTKFSLQGSVASGVGSAGTATAASSFRARYASAYLLRMADGANPVTEVTDGVPFVIKYKDAMTGAGHSLPSGILTRASVWNGAAAVNHDHACVPVIVTNSPLFWYADTELDGVSMSAVDSNKTNWPVGFGAFRVVHGTGGPPAGAPPEGGAWNVGDTYIRTDVVSGAASRWRCTTAGGAGVAVWKVECTLA